MESDPGSRRMVPSGLLIQRVGDHVTSADRLIEQSQQLIARIRDRMHQTERRVERTFLRPGTLLGWRGWPSGRPPGPRSATCGPSSGSWPRAIRRHEAAVLQERLGHPDRAANAREHGRQARELHAQALQELHGWARQPWPPANSG
jgi:hypothetical protein